MASSKSCIQLAFSSELVETEGHEADFVVLTVRMGKTDLDTFIMPAGRDAGSLLTSYAKAFSDIGVPNPHPTTENPPQGEGTPGNGILGVVRNRMKPTRKRKSK